MGTNQTRQDKTRQSFGFYVPLYRVLSLNNSKFGDYFDRIYSIELDTTETEKFASYLDLHLESDSKGGLRTKIYEKDDRFSDFKLSIPVAHAYGVYIS